MDIAAQQVQREVERVACQGDDQKYNDVSGNGAQRVEHLGDNAAGQHQGHQSGIGQEISEIAGHVVINRAENTRDLAHETLTGDDGTQHHQRKADIQHHIAVTQRHDADAGKDDPPGQLFKHGVQHLALLQLADEADGHAGDDLDKAQAHSAHQDHKRVVQRSEQRRQGEVRAGGQLDHLGQKVAEEAAGNGAHDEGAHAAQRHQAEHMAHGALGTVLFRDEQSCQDHQNAVAHIRHHDAVKQNEKRRHQRVGVHIVIGRQRIHLRHHIQRTGQPIVFQLYGDGRVLLLRGVPGLPGAAQPLQKITDLAHALSGGPALEKEDGAVGQKPFRVALLGRLGAQPVGVQTERVPLRAVFHDLRFRGLPGSFVFGQERIQCTQVLFCGARHILERHSAEIERAQTVHNGLLLCAQADQEVIGLLLVCAYFKDLCRVLAQGLPDRACICAAGAHPHAEEHMRRSLIFQGHIQPLPGLQRCPLCPQAALLALQTGNGLQEGVNPLTGRLGPRCCLVPQKLRF